MLYEIVIQTIFFLPALVRASCYFRRQSGQLMSTTQWDLVSVRVVNSVSVCERYCLEHLTECLAANMVPLRRGIYSCELFSDASLQNLQPSEGSIFVLKAGK
jgi:hypothetical protein